MVQQQLTISPNGVIFLVLPNKEYKSRREIGRLSGDGKTLHVQRNTSNQLFNSLDGFGFNYELIRDGSFEKVIVHLPFGQLLETSRKHILEYGRILNFKKNKLDRQIFLSLAEFGLDKLCNKPPQIAWHKKQNNQPSLFGGEQ